eukprot:scaffold164457_cov34-Prasinocladus_malaysianus.AAC.2
MPGEAAVAVFAAVGFLVGSLFGAGLVYFLTKRGAAKAARKRPMEGKYATLAMPFLIYTIIRDTFALSGWRISAAAHTYAQRAEVGRSAGQGTHRRRQKPESIDDETFAKLLKQTVLVLGKDATRKAGSTADSPGKKQHSKEGGEPVAFGSPTDVYANTNKGAMGFVTCR